MANIQKEKESVLIARESISKCINKHAYLIMAHGNWEILKKLILLLDNEKHDIYLHIDAKIGDFDDAVCQLVRFSKVVLVERKTVYWADYSQVEVTLELLKSARKNGTYSYYHLLSGTDLPIKSNEERYEFFENSGKEFIGIVPNEVWYSVRRVRFYHPFLHNIYYRNSKVLKICDRLLEYVQRCCGINRLKDCDWKIIDGWTWFSITEQYCNYVLLQEEKIRKIFSKSIASDELFLQTLAYNSEFYKRLYDVSDLKYGSMRFIDWERGQPYTWGADEKDYETLMSSPYMFARKFDKTHLEIVEQIFEEIDRRNKNDQ